MNRERKHVIDIEGFIWINSNCEIKALKTLGVPESIAFQIAGKELNMHQKEVKISTKVMRKNIFTKIN